MEDKNGKVHWMEAVGVNSLTESNPLRDEAAVRRAFPEIREGAVKRPVGAAGPLISITEKHLHSQGGIRKGRLRLSKTLLGCRQVLTGMDKKEKGGAKGRAPQGETPAQSMKGKSFHITASNNVITKETHRQETENARKTSVAQQGPKPRALHQGSAVKSGTESQFAGAKKLRRQ